MNNELDWTADTTDVCYTLEISPPLKHCLPLDWKEFNRRAKLYFRQRVAERRHERNRRENTYSLRVKEMARIRNPR